MMATTDIFNSLIQSKRANSGLEWDIYFWWGDLKLSRHVYHDVRTNYEFLLTVEHCYICNRNVTFNCYTLQSELFSLNPSFI